jgi:hypothetical protein
MLLIFYTIFIDHIIYFQESQCLFRIWGFHSSGYEEYYLMGCNAA